MSEQKEITNEEFAKMTVKEVHDLCDRQTKCGECPLFDWRMAQCVVYPTPAGWPIWEVDE